MNIRSLAHEIGWNAVESLGVQAGTRPSYMHQIAGGHRQPSPELCRRLVALEPRLSLQALRPDVYGPLTQQEA